MDEPPGNGNDGGGGHTSAGGDDGGGGFKSEEVDDGGGGHTSAAGGGGGGCDNGGGFKSVRGGGGGNGHSAGGGDGGGSIHKSERVDDVASDDGKGGGERDDENGDGEISDTDDGASGDEAEGGDVSECDESGGNGGDIGDRHGGDVTEDGGGVVAEGGIACGLDDCGYQSGRRGNLSRHRTTMHRCLASPLLCCRVAFGTKHEYERHRRRAHAAGYRCSECGRVFGRRALLTRHSYIHADRKPFQCGACQRYSTASKSNLRRHLLVCGRPSGPGEAAVVDGRYHRHGPALRTTHQSQPPPLPSLQTLPSTLPQPTLPQLPLPAHQLAPLFRASIHISCGPCGSSTGAPGWLPWPTTTASAEGAALAGALPYAMGARLPPPAVTGGATGAHSSALLPPFGPRLFFSPLASVGQPTPSLGPSSSGAQEALRAVLAKERAMLAKDVAERPIFWPRMAPNLSTTHEKHTRMPAGEDDTGPALTAGEDLIAKTSRAPAGWDGAARGSAPLQRSSSSGAHPRKVYRSFRVSDILALDD